MNAKTNGVHLRTAGEQRVPTDVYEQVLDAGSALVALDTPVATEIVQHLRQTAQRRGHSIYYWNPNLGLTSLREHGIVVAGSKRLADALRFVSQSSHFGVYVFPSEAREYTPQILALLRQIARGKDGGDKRVVMIGEGGQIPPALSDLAFLIRHRHGPADRLRLRDGRWVRG